MFEKKSMLKYLVPTEFINSNDKKVISFVNDVIGTETEKEKAIISLFYEIRDRKSVV